MYAESRPHQQRLYDLASQVAQQQLGFADKSAARGDQQWQEYVSTYLPAERQMVRDAMEYDAPARRERLRSEAMMDTSSALGAQEGVMRRELARMGANPNSGRYLGLQRMSKVLGAATTAGAGNAAARGLEDKAISLRAGAASFGRNMPNTAGQSLGLATQAGSAATANQNQGFMAALPYAQFASGGVGNQLGAAGLGVQGNLGMGGLMNQAYTAQANNSGGLLGGLMGVAGLGIKAYGAGMFG